MMQSIIEDRVFSKISLFTIKAYGKGYRVINNHLYSHTGKCLSTIPNKDGYHKSGVEINGYKNSLYVHKLLAYQKFGIKAFHKKVCIRHLNGRPDDNTYENIAIGSLSDNAFDIPVDKRKERVINGVKQAAIKNSKFSNVELQKIRDFHSGSYKETMNKFGITSKGTLHRILNTIYVVEGVIDDQSERNDFHGS